MFLNLEGTMSELQHNCVSALFPHDGGRDVRWLHFPRSVPRLPLSEGKPASDLQLCVYNEDKGDRGEDTANAARLRWEKEIFFPPP